MNSPRLSLLVGPEPEPVWGLHTLTVQPAAQDTYIYSYSPTLNYATQAMLYVGDFHSSYSVAQRSLLAFDLSAIPAGAIITSVALSLFEYIAATTGLASWPVELRRVLRNWVDVQGSWNIFSTGNNWGTAGCANATDRVAAASASLTMDGTPQAGFVSWSGAGLVADVQAWVDGTAPNYGWLLGAPTAEYQGSTGRAYNQFYSSNYATAIKRPKLVIGYTYGAQDDVFYDFAPEATAIGERTKVMPGGDASLTFTLPASVAAAHRQQLANGALVRLKANGAPDFGGRVCNDPVGDLLSAIKTPVSVDASGLWAWAGRNKAFGWVWGDTDTAQWQKVRQHYKAASGELVDLDGQDKFTVDTEGRLYIRAAKDRAHVAYASSGLAYRLLGGLDTGCEIVGLDVDYKCNTPGAWDVRFRSCVTPWDGTSTLLLAETENRTEWHLETLNLAAPAQCVQVVLQRQNAADGVADEDGVASDPWVWVRSVTVRCRYSSGTTVDRDVNLSAALCDMATMDGLATVTVGDEIGSPLDQLAVLPDLPKSVRDGMTEVAGLHTGELEHWFDLDASGASRFCHYEKPVACDWTRNSCWHYGDAAGESVDDLLHDPEACPDWVRLLHLSSGVATVPNGTPRDVWFPLAPPAGYGESVLPLTAYSEVKLTDSQAAAAAARIYARIAASLWTGSVPIPFTITDVRGRVRGGWQVRPGDRISVPRLNGASDLYVTEASWNWTTLTGSATVGYPWEVDVINSAKVSASAYRGGIMEGGRPGPGPSW